MNRLRPNLPPGGNGTIVAGDPDVARVTATVRSRIGAAASEAEYALGLALSPQSATATLSTPHA